MRWIWCVLLGFALLFGGCSGEKTGTRDNDVDTGSGNDEESNNNKNEEGDSASDEESDNQEKGDDDPSDEKNPDSADDDGDSTEDEDEDSENEDEEDSENEEGEGTENEEGEDSENEEGEDTENEEDDDSDNEDDEDTENEDDEDSENEDDDSENEDDEDSENEDDDAPVGDYTGWEVFSQSEIVEFRFTMAESDFSLMEENADEVYRSAALHVVGGSIDETFDEVGLRHKGNWTREHCVEMGGRSYEEECAKISYKAKFDWAEPEDNSDSEDQDWRLFGLKRLNLHSMQTDQRLLREALAYDIFREAGVRASRTSYAKVFINDELMGLFLAVENVDGRWTASRFPDDKDGNLYKEVWPTHKISDPDVRDFLINGSEGFGGVREPAALAALKTNDNPEDNPDISGFEELADAIAATDEGSFASIMEALIDLDGMYTYMAVDRATRNWDGVTAFYDLVNMQPHNYYWYHEPAVNRWHIIPWDLSDAIWYYDPFMHPEAWVADPDDPRDEPNEGERLPDWNEAVTNCDGMMDAVTIAWGNPLMPPGCDRLLSLLAATDWDRFVSAGNDILAGPLDLERMQGKVDEWMAKIDAAVEEDPHEDHEMWHKKAMDFRDSILPNMVSDFEAHLNEGYIQ